ncbi:nucleotidyltransferase family protein [Desulfobacter latus]|uniref:CBS domain-containing protein n=1 Tax=Desulfobacter latus TaxID=2292 RepID=A0A850SV00_9BACT|nr:nucleotidyltransferase family protein [Desulfobacter latus]NWH04979.1 CBS domain-containing protein [Desulfobacter latus]
MESWKSIIISPDNTILDAIRVIDGSHPLLTALVADNEMKLLGTVTDGDIRRGILNRISMDAPVSKIMHTQPIALNVSDHPKKINAVFHKNLTCRAIPILDDQGKIIAIKQGNTVINQSMPNPVFIMAGGLGTRLRPLTNDCPKPMLRVGNKPILEIILNNFIENGFSNFFISLNYKAEMIEDYFGDGTHLGACITYIKEKKRLGTAGSLSLLESKPNHPIIVMNGDLLTKVNFCQLLEYHHAHNAQATLCIREHEFQLPFGVVQIDNYKLTGLKEKPIETMFVNAGIYTINPDIIDFIPLNQYFDMTDLFEQLLEKGITPSAFPIREYWLDIGRLSEYEKADQVYMDIFQKNCFTA